MINEEIVSRKEFFSQQGISSYDAYAEAGTPSIPRIVIMVDNLTVFKDICQKYEDDFVNICREGLALGVTVIVTAKQTSGLSYKYFSNFATRLALNCTESSEYSTIFDRCRMQPQDIPGRGLVSVDKEIYEYQAYLAFEGETETQRNEKIRAFISQMGSTHGAERAKSIPSIPPVLTSSYWATNGLTFADYVVPVGLTYSDISPVVIDLTKIGAVGV